MKTQTDPNARSVPIHRFVRLVDSLAGQYCKLEAGEMVMIVPMYEEDGETFWRVARKQWVNHLTISNVLASVPDHALIVEEPNVKDHSPIGAVGASKPGKPRANAWDALNEIAPNIAEMCSKDVGAAYHATRIEV